MTQQADTPVKLVMFASALAVLKCPMSVEDKINTLTAAINEEVKVLGYVPKIPTTGLVPFDTAVGNLTLD